MRAGRARRGAPRKCRYWRRASMKIGINLWPQNTSWELLQETALLVDRLRFDSLWVWDHFYAINGDTHRPNFEGWQLQPAYAAITQNVRVEIGRASCRERV